MRERRKTIKRHFDSMGDLSDTARKWIPNYAPGIDESNAYWTGVNSFDEASDLAITGWVADYDDTMRIVDSTIAKVQKEVNLERPTTYMDFSGACVDMGLYVTGDPECMMEFCPDETEEVARSVTICASVSFSGSISQDSIVARGRVIVALIVALDRLGIGTEVWVDESSQGDNHILRQRMMVKASTAPLDVPRLMFALAHPAMLRTHFMPAMHDQPKEIWKSIGCQDGGYGMPINPIRDMGDSAVYFDAICSATDIRNPERLVIDRLREIGIA